METLLVYIQPFLGWLLNATLVGSLIVCLVLLIQTTLGGKLGPRWSYALWLVLVVRMVLPWAPSSRLSLSNLIPSWDRQTQSRHSTENVKVEETAAIAQLEDATETEPDFQSQDDAAAETLANVTPSAVTEVKSQPRQWLVSLRGFLPIIWLAGAIVIGIYLTVSDLALWRIVKRDRPLVNQSMLELFEECKAQMSIQSLVVVVPSEKVKSPGLFGFVRPRLLLPREMLDTATHQEMRYVFLHELAHLKRHDIYLGWLTSLLQVLHWFNPLIWFAFYRMRADRELACDALVLTRTGQDKSQEYGGAILGLVRRFSRLRPLPAMAGIMESKSQLKRRIAMITQYKHNSYRFSPLAAVLIVILACLSLPDAIRTKASETLASKPADQPNFRKIQIPYDASRLHDAQLSPDGKSIAFVLDHKLWIMPRVGKLGPDIPGSPRLLDTGDIELAWQGLAWSGDGRWIAFHGKDELNEEEKRWGNRGVYVISVDGGKPKEVYEKWRYGDWLVNYRMSLSPNGKTLAFSCVDANEQHIYTTGADGGVPKRLLEAPAREPVFSPDGKRIAYVADKNRGAKGGGLWVVSADGGTPTLIADAGNATSPVWSPDGRMIAFLDQTMAKQIFIVPIGDDGEPAGEKITIDSPDGVDLVRRLTGWTSDDKLGTVFACQGQYGLYTLPATGGIVTLAAHGGELLSQPRWSGDGKRIIVTVAAGEGRDGWKRNGLASISAEGGEISMIPIRADSPVIKLSYGGGNHVSPDGKTIVFAGRKKDQKEWWFNHIWTLPIEGGQPTQLTDAPAPLTDWYPCWSPDGKAIAFIRSKTDPTEFNAIETDIFIVPADGGEPRRLTHKSDKVLFGYIAWSPDGKWLSYFSAAQESPGFEAALMVVPSEGGQSRVVGKLEQKGFDIRMESAWSADSKRIAFIGTDYKVIKIMSLDDGSVMEVDPHLSDTNIWHLDWSGNGNRLAFSGCQGGGLGFWMMENFLPAATVGNPILQQPTQRRIEVLTHSPRRIHSTPSLDRRYMASTDRTGRLVVSESATGKKWNLSEQGGVSGLGILPLISPENTRIVYSWMSFEDGTWEARIVALDGSDDRLLLPAEKIPGWLYVDTWSLDGQFLFCRHARPDKDNGSRLVRVSVDDGAMQYIDVVDANGLSKVDISSDGRFLAYHRQDKTTSKSDIFIFDLLENRESVLVCDQADDKLLGWTPDGQKIFFTSDRMGTTDGWLLAVQQGQPKGLPKMIKPGIGDVNPIRLTRDGALYYSVQYEAWNVYTVELDLAAGKALSEPKAVRDMGKDSSPDWSPDGRYLAYRSQPDPDRPRVIRIRTLETGEERELKPDLPCAEYIRWHPDSRHILVPYLKSAGLAGVSQIDIKTGQCRDLMTASVVEGELIRQAELSADGKTLAYRVKDGGHGNRLVVRDMETGLEKVLLSMDDLVRAGMPGGNSWTLMPDGKHLALSILDGTYQLKVMSVADRTSRTIVPSFFGQLTCANDGHDLLIVRGKDDKELWRVATIGSKLRKVWEFEQLIGDPRLHPDGRHLAFVSGTFISEMWVMENFLPTAAVAGSGE